jgi:hypothetical protein
MSGVSRLFSSLLCPGRDAQIVAVRVDDSEVPQAPWPLLRRLEDRMPRVQDASVGGAEVIYFHDYLHAKATSLGSDALREVPARFGQLSDRTYPQHDVPRTQARVVSRLFSHDLEA